MTCASSSATVIASSDRPNDDDPKPHHDEASEDDDLAGRGELEPAGAEAVEPDEVVEGEVEPDRRLSEPAGFAGPLPPPHVLDEYEHVVPGLKHDIVDQWKTETAHRRQTVDGMRKTDHRAMRAYYEGEKRGQFLGFAILVGVLGVAVLAILTSQPWVGIAALGAAGTAIWALRRDSRGDSGDDPPTDIGNGDDVEKLPPGSNRN